MSMNWKEVTDSVRVNCRGDLSTVPRDSQFLFDLPCESKVISDSSNFNPITKGISVNSNISVPRGHWLREHEEKGQSFKSFTRSNFRAQPHASFDTIYVQPLGDFSGSRAPSLTDICDYLKVFFSPLNIDMVKGTPIESVPTLKSRINDYSNNVQLKTDDILSWLQKESTKDRGRVRKQVCAIVITMYDVYPDENWNFVFGLANLVEGTGVWSFARMDPAFPSTSTEPCTFEEENIIIRRCVKVITHELCHLFGQRHCIYYECLMNGSNHLDELDAKSCFLCPICLRKLYEAYKFDGLNRYKGLFEWRQRHRHEYESNWLANRIKSLDLLAEE